MEENKELTLKEKLTNWYEENKTWVKPVSIGLGLLGMYYFGWRKGMTTHNQNIDVAEATLHMHGFLKYFDPSTGQEINRVQAKELIDAYYKK